MQHDSFSRNASLFKSDPTRRGSMTKVVERFIVFSAVAFLLLSTSLSAQNAKRETLEKWTNENLESVLKLYQKLHMNPELSFEEAETAATIAKELEAVGAEVHMNIGGHGVLGLLKNGDGPTLMLRTDLDALPVTEQTPVPYASVKKVENEDGVDVGVMHACGHDIHMSNLIGVARFMSEHKEMWSGTLMLIGQPAEERGAGATAMLKDGLFEKFKKPDFAVALHVDSTLATGQIAFRPGYTMANVDSVDITMHGRGGHGSAPHTTIDPVMLAAQFVVQVQTIVSREIDPLESAVITVGSIHGGTKHNIIGNDCHLQLTVRSYSDDVREHLLEGIKRKAKAVAIGADAKEPTIEISEGTPSLANDEELAAKLKPVFVSALGEERVEVAEPVMGGEDFSQFGRAGVPILMYRLGAVDQSRLDRYKELDIPAPSLHSAIFYPDAPEALTTGIVSMSAVALELLKPASAE